MKWANLFFGMGLIFWIGSGICISIIAIRYRSDTKSISSSVNTKLDSFDIKICIIGAAAFALGSAAILIGVLFEDFYF